MDSPRKNVCRGSSSSNNILPEQLYNARVGLDGQGEEWDTRGGNVCTNVEDSGYSPACEKQNEQHTQVMVISLLFVFV